VDKGKTVLVTGGTGTTGREVTRLLRAEGWPARTAGRGEDADIRFDWSDPATHSAALAGVDRVYLIAPVGEADPAAQVGPFLDRALGLGVRRVVLLSSSAVEEGDAGLGRVHHLVRTVVPEWAVLRPSWFQQNIVGKHPIADSIRTSGVIVTATGDGRVPFIDARDIAAVGVRALIDPAPHNAEHVLTGPETLSYADVAALVTSIAGRAVRHESVSTGEMADRLTAAGYPRSFSEQLALLDEGIRHGSEDRTTATVERVTGRAPRALDALLRHSLTELLDSPPLDSTPTTGGSS
jgi:uncharacterized protein YbjT (DUF2867 family)